MHTEIAVQAAAGQRNGACSLVDGPWTGRVFAALGRGRGPDAADQTSLPVRTRDAGQSMSEACVRAHRTQTTTDSELVLEKEEDEGVVGMRAGLGGAKTDASLAGMRSGRSVRRFGHAPSARVRLG